MVIAWVVFLTVLFAQLPSLIREEKWKEVVIFLVMWLTGAVYGTAVLMEALPTNPTELIIDIMSNLYRWMGRMS